MCERTGAGEMDTDGRMGQVDGDLKGTAPLKASVFSGCGLLGLLFPSSGLSGSPVICLPAISCPGLLCSVLSHLPWPLCVFTAHLGLSDPLIKCFVAVGLCTQFYRHIQRAQRPPVCAKESNEDREPWRPT